MPLIVLEIVVFPGPGKVAAPVRFTGAEMVSVPALDVRVLDPGICKKSPPERVTPVPVVTLLTSAVGVDASPIEFTMLRLKSPAALLSLNCRVMLVSPAISFTMLKRLFAAKPVVDVSKIKVLFVTESGRKPKSAVPSLAADQLSEFQYPPTVFPSQ